MSYTKLLTTLLLVTSLSSCVTPEYWSPDDHKSVMMRCRIMCGDKRVQSYDPWLGKCSCRGDK